MDEYCRRRRRRWRWRQQTPDAKKLLSQRARCEKLLRKRKLIFKMYGTCRTHAFLAWANEMSEHKLDWARYTKWIFCFSWNRAANTRTMMATPRRRHSLKRDGAQRSKQKNICERLHIRISLFFLSQRILCSLPFISRANYTVRLSASNTYHYMDQRKRKIKKM